jgi:HemY protein
MRLMATSKFMLDQHDPHAALKALQELRDSGVKGHPGALTLELKAQRQLGNWDSVLNVLEQMEKRKAIDATLAAQLRQQAWLGKISQQEDMAGLAACLKNIPADFKRRGKIATAAAQRLMQFGGCPMAQQLLTDSLNAQWDSELVALFGDCQPAAGQSGDVIAQIEQAEKWLKQHKDDAGLLLALGKLCMHQRLWGKAQNYLEASISVAPGPAAYNALARLAERLGKPEEAAKYFQRATALK